MGAAHDREVTNGGKASMLNVTLRAVNAVVGNIRTAPAGTYDAIRFAKCGCSLLAEVWSCVNWRYKSTLDGR
jgi:hypothetical protein